LMYDGSQSHDALRTVHRSEARWAAVVRTSRAGGLEGLRAVRTYSGLAV